MLVRTKRLLTNSGLELLGVFISLMVVEALLRVLTVETAPRVGHLA